MTEASVQQHPAPPPPEDDCPSPWGPYTDYEVEASVAQQAETLYTADKAVVDPKYDKLDGAQGRYETAWSAQKAKWEDLERRLKRIKEQLECVLGRKELDYLLECWRRVRDETEEETAPADCDDVDNLECDDLPDQILELRRLVTLAGVCVTQVDTAFDDLAGLPDGLAGQITGLADRVTKLEEYNAGANSDARRAYVEYLAIWRDFCRLKAKLTTAAAYACKLKKLFVLLLDRHTKAICLQLAVHRWDKHKEFEDKAKQEKAKHLIDLVLECAQPKPTADGGEESPAYQTEQPGAKPAEPSASGPAGAAC